MSKKGSEYLDIGVNEFTSPNDPVLEAMVTGDAHPRIRLTADGTLKTGDGTIAPSGTSVPKTQTAPDALAHTVWQYQPFAAASGPALVSIGEPSFNGTPDFIQYFATNVNVGGSLVDPTKPGAYWAIESSYDDASGHIKSELHCGYVHTDLSNPRPFMSQFDHTTGHLCAVEIHCPPNGSGAFVITDETSATIYQAFDSDRVRYYYNGANPLEFKLTSAMRAQFLFAGLASNGIYFGVDAVGAPNSTPWFAVGAFDNSAVGLFANGPSGDNSVKALVARGRAAQTGNLFEAQLSTTVAQFAVTAAGLPKWSTAGMVQTTVGAAGGASAIPASPTKYLKVVGDDGVTYVVPAFAAA